ncbi:isoleucine--tRNA ligase [Marininema halotolerans]|uniref:isoleucine--tRNA ligase n=1 Tax=Marininema halotolerans TaxID=1155944 RepID=UPI000B86158C|nr:isoleucine--tRNA ligase [Marininema halotolerans]
MDYKKTLNLPETAFPMRGNLPNREPEMQAWWDETDIYGQVAKKRAGKPKFILHDGPPYANGDIHIGHALNKILKDFIVRYKSLQGYDAPYIPGWDTHGLPIEQAVTSKKKVDRKKMDPVAFRKICEDYALSFVEKQKEQFKRLGVRGDWDHPYITLKPEYEAEQIRLFGEMAKRGHVYRGYRSIYWSPSSESALADAEIEYQDKRSPSIYVAFDVKDGKGKLSEDVAVIIWTTTPWTLPANLGIALGAEFTYVVVSTTDGRKFLVAEELADHVMQLIGIEGYNKGATFRGEELEGIQCQHPFYDRESPILLGDHVSLDAGTGCVHTAPGHGVEDFELGKKYGLDVLCPVDEKGKLTHEAPGFEGLFYDDANKVVTEKLKESGHLLKLVFITHQYPHDWRTKKPVIFRATEQWFASIDGFRDAMLHAIKEVKWTPAWGETRLGNMVEDRKDWCISRQRVWGVPLPIFYCNTCSEPYITDESIEFIADRFGQEGSSVWFSREVQELLPEGACCHQCGNETFRKETDIMDVWFDSGSSHAAVLEAREETSWPADLYLEGSDQYRGWFNSSLTTSVATKDQAPYRQVLSHGFTLDGEGKKMSKSLGNTIDPLKVMKNYGADILRLWVSSTDYQADVRVSEDILKQIAEVYRKVRNTLRFLLGNLADFVPGEHAVAVAELDEIDRYALIQLQRLIEKVTAGYESYDFHAVYYQIHYFCTVFLSQFYLDVLKDRLYTLPANDAKRRSSQTVMAEILKTLVVLSNPILPHTTEEVWKFVPGTADESIQLTDFPQVEPSVLDVGLEEKWDRLTVLRDIVLKALEEARAKKVIGNSLGAALELYPSPSNFQLLHSIQGSLTELFIVSQVHVNQGETEEELQVQVKPAAGEKCQRCWVISSTVGESKDYPELCDRCADTVAKHYADVE